MVVVIEALAIDVLTDVDLIVVGVIAIALKLVVSVSYTVGVPAARAFGLFKDALADVIVGILTTIGVEVLADGNTNAFAVAMAALEFPVSTPLGGFSR